MPPRTTTRKTSSAGAIPKARRVTVRHLRELHAGVTPCPQTQAHIRVQPVARARQMLQSISPVLAEDHDGSLEPRGYASTIAALLQVVSPEETVWCMVHPAESAPLASPVPLILEFDSRLDDDTLMAFAHQLANYWRSLGVTSVPRELIASEMSLSATTYARKVGIAYQLVSDCSLEPANDIMSEPSRRPAYEAANDSHPEPVHDVVSTSTQEPPTDVVGEPYPDDEGEPDFDWPTDTPSYEDSFPGDTDPTYDMLKRH